MRNYNDEGVLNDFMSAFDCLPLCAIINDKIYAVHAGLSPSLHSVDEIDALNRFQEIPLISVASGLLSVLDFTKVCSATSCGRIQRR